MATATKPTAARAKQEKTAAAEAAEGISADIQALRDDVDELMQHIGGLVKAEAAAGTEMVTDTRDRALEQGEEVLDRSKEYIRENPLVACAAALGSGFVAATLLRR